MLDLLCGPTVKNPSADAGDTGLNPGLGRPCIFRGPTVTKAMLCSTRSLRFLELVLCTNRSHHEKPVHPKQRAAPAGHSQRKPGSREDAVQPKIKKEKSEGYTSLKLALTSRGC